MKLNNDIEKILLECVNNAQLIRECRINEIRENGNDLDDPYVGSDTLMRSNALIRNIRIKLAFIRSYEILTGKNEDYLTELQLVGVLLSSAHEAFEPVFKKAEEYTGLNIEKLKKSFGDEEYTPVMVDLLQTTLIYLKLQENTLEGGK